MFTFIDLIYTLIILFFALIGLFNGFINEVFKKISVLLSLCIGFVFSGNCAPFFKTWIKNDTICTIVAFIALFIISYIVIRILQMILDKIFSQEILKGLNRFLGFVFGIAEGLLVICVVMIFAKSQKWFNLSVLTDGTFYYGILKGIIEVPVSRLQGIFA